MLGPWPGFLKNPENASSCICLMEDRELSGVDKVCKGFTKKIDIEEKKAEAKRLQGSKQPRELAKTQGWKTGGSKMVKKMKFSE